MEAWKNLSEELLVFFKVFADFDKKALETDKVTEVVHKI